MNILELRNKLYQFFEGESSGHDIYHADRVLKMARRIQNLEGGDIEVIEVSALVHDMYRPWENKTGRKHFGKEALDMMEQFLNDITSNKILISKVIEVVKLHDIYDWTEKIDKSLELKIVQDADNLDAIGAIGIGRTFAFGGANGLSIYTPNENLSFVKDFVEDPRHRTTTIAHFYEKLLKLKDNMNTHTGRLLAEKRHVFMQSFLDEFFKEWEAKD